MDLTEIMRKKAILMEKLERKGFGFIPGFEGKYTGMYRPLGGSTVENSPMCSDQIEFAMLLSGHPLVESFVQGENLTPFNFNPEPLYEAQILRGMKIMDLGCGHEPTFARCARTLGAEVYTADLISAEDFEFDSEYLNQPQRETEKSHHIQTDLSATDAVEIINRISGGDFNLTTEAHLQTDGCYCGRKVAKGILKKEKGIYFYASGQMSYAKTQQEIAK